jgi:hypothetical protein
MCATASGPDVKRALLLVWTDIPTDIETEFNDWYDREHLRERVEVPGFIRGRRFAAISATPRYLALYEAQSAEVMRSEAYLRLKRTRDARSMRFVPLFRNAIKATCDIVSHAGAGEGAFLVLLPITADPERLSFFRDRVVKTFFSELVQSTGVVSATYAAHNSTARETSAAHDVRAGDRHLENVLLIEAASELGASTAVSHLNPQALERHGVRPYLVEKPCVFRVLYTLHA